MNKEIKRKWRNTGEKNKIELFCTRCENSLGKFDFDTLDLSTYFYCDECSELYTLHDYKMPCKITESTDLIKDNGNNCIIRKYLSENNYQEEVKLVYNEEDGKRYIKIGNNKWYLQVGVVVGTKVEIITEKFKTKIEKNKLLPEFVEFLKKSEGEVFTACKYKRRPDSVCWGFKEVEEGDGWHFHESDLRIIENIT